MLICMYEHITRRLFLENSRVSYDSACQFLFVLVHSLYFFEVILQYIKSLPKMPVGHIAKLATMCC